MMPLICPGCGGRMDIEAERELVPFSCPYCAATLTPQKNGQAVVLKALPAAPVNRQVSPVTPVSLKSFPAREDASALLRQAQEQSDPIKRYALLQMAEEAAPDNLLVQKALLLHGRLHERDRHKIDFSVIKSYLLHVFEEPETYSFAKREDRIRELISEDRLVRAMDMAPDGQAFLKDYLTALSQEYIHLFLRGSSRHMKPIFGFAPAGKPSRLLAAPAANMLRCMLKEQALSQDQREMLAGAFYKAYGLEFQGETIYLDEALGVLAEQFSN
jgi:hypothetical protein